MFYRKPIKPVLPALAILLGAFLGLIPSGAVAQAAAGYQFIDAGAVRNFVLAQDEVYVQTPVPLLANNLRARIEAALPGLTVLDSTDSHALVKLPHIFDAAKARTHSDEVSTTFPDAKLFPVLYVEGVPAGKGSRRIITTKILVKVPEGTSAAELSAKVGATSIRPTSEAGLVIFIMPTAHDVLSALAALKAAGVNANPMLGHSWEAMALPKDRFFPAQWHLHNTGQQGSKLGIDVNILDAWKVTLGAGITISIVDSCLQTNHPDLLPNVPAVNSLLHYDFLDEDIDPNPHFGDQHGTSVAGVAAAAQNNGSFNPSDNSYLGVTGASPSSRLLGLRLINESGFVPVTDDEEASALYWKPQGNAIVDISNNSWGPRTAAFGLLAPDVLTRAALRDAAVLGRGGKGQITLFAAGNGNGDGSEANLNGYANSRFVIAVGAIDNLGGASFYSEIGANVLVSAPSNGGTLGIVTTDTTGVEGYNPPTFGTELADTNYTNSFGGTSSATPLTAGVCALMLGANPDLTWRDVKEILISTAVQVDIPDPDWINNAAGFKFNHKYGGGMVDASAAVIRSLDWSHLAQEQDQSIAYQSNVFPLKIPDDGGTVGLPLQFNFSGPNFPNLRVETVEVAVSIAHERRSDLSITLVSPDGTKSLLVAGGTPLGDDKNFKYSVFDGPQLGWIFTSNHHWGENSTGTWKVLVADKLKGTLGKLESASVHIYGTPSTPQRIKFEKARYNISEPDNVTSGGSPSVLTVNVQRLGPPVGIAQVDFSTSPRGTATASGLNVVNPDYSPVGGTITFADGETNKEINIPILHDTIAEEDEVIYLLLKNPRGASLGGINLATILIRDNDSNTVSVEATDPIAKEPTEGVAADNGTFTISRTVPSPAALTVKYLIGGTATFGSQPGGDYTLSSSSIIYNAIIPPNETSTTVTVVTREDGNIEGTETVDLTILSDDSGTYAVGAPSTAQVRILDHDRPFVKISSSLTLLKEEDPNRVAHVRIMRYANDPASAPTINATDLEVDLSFTGTQLNGSNYVDAHTLKPLPEKVVIPVGQSEVVLDVIPKDDSVYQAIKTVVISLANNPNREFDFGFPSSITLTILEDEQLPDAVIPRTVLSEPKNGARIVSPNKVLVSGTATDNSGINRVEYRINGSEWKVISSAEITGASAKWNFELGLPDIAGGEVRYGFNTLEIASVDSDGNRSKISSALFKYVKEQALTVSVAGAGSVSPGFLPTSTREAGLTYSIAARPAPGQVFKGWTGLVTSPARTISFVMPASEATLQAEFVPSPFVPALVGRYSGLARNAVFAVESSGYVDLNVTSSGLFSGKLLLPGSSYAFRGEFSGDGLFVGTIPRKNDLPFEVSLKVDLSPEGSQQIIGTIVSSGFTLNVQADHAVYGRANPLPDALVKSYTIVLPPNAPLGNTQFDPHGNGYGVAKIDSAGLVHANITLGDGTKIVLNQPLSKDLTWAFYSQPYLRKGVVLGIITQDATQTDSDFHGQIDWFKPTRATDKIYPQGFTVHNNDVIGSIYTPAAGGRVLAGFASTDGNAKLTIDEGNIVNPIIKSATYDDSNKVIITTPGTDSVSLNINTKTGTFSGSFLHPVSSKRTPINGVLFQKQNIGVGSFLGSSISGVTIQTGKVLLEPAQPPANAPQ